MSLSSFLSIHALALLTLCIACQPVSGAIELSTPSPEQEQLDEYRKTLTSWEIQAGLHCLSPIGENSFARFKEIVRKQHALDTYTALKGHPNAKDREYLENGNYEETTWFSEDEELQDALAFDVYDYRISPVGEGGKHRFTLKFRTDEEDRRQFQTLTYEALGTVDHKTCEPTLLSISD